MSEKDMLIPCPNCNGTGHVKGEFTKEFGAWVHALRRRREFSQVELAEKLDMSQAWLSRVEAGTTDPSIGALQKFNRLDLTDDEANGLRKLFDLFFIKR